jgi:hypothetical protein
MLEKIFQGPSENREKLSNPLKSEHLIESAKPIMACMGTPKQFKDNPGDEKEAFQNSNPDFEGTHSVNYYDDPEELKKKEFKNEGIETYVITTVDSFDKYSDGFRNCTGIVAAGKDKKTGEEISFMSHQDSREFLSGGIKDKFFADLKDRLAELKERSVEGTVDAVIVGGNYFEFTSSEGESVKKHYLDSIDLLSKETSEVLGFEPVIIAGPKLTRGDDTVFYSNKERKLYMMRPEVGDRSAESYLGSNIKEQEKKWQEKEQN